MDGDDWPDAEILDLDPPEQHRGSEPGPRLHVLPWLLVGGLLVALIGTGLARPSSTSPDSGARPSGRASSPGATSGSSEAAGPPTPGASGVGDGAGASSVVVTQVGHRLLGVTAGWEVFARGDGLVLRIELAAGRITRTSVPSLDSGGPVGLVAGRDRVLVRPLDHVTGYVIPDGRPARELSGLLAGGGPVLPGPDPGHVWVADAGLLGPAMTLTTLDGDSADRSVPVPPDTSPVSVAADGSGYLLLDGVGGVYLGRPGSLRRVTSGTVVAAGAAGWLTVECDAEHRCSGVLRSRSGAAHPVPGPVPVTAGYRGLVSPDGLTAALFTTRPGGLVEVTLVDLRSGRRTALPFTVDPTAGSGVIAWTPDSRRLLAVDRLGFLLVVDRATAVVGNLGVPVPQVRQLALRGG